MGKNSTKNNANGKNSPNSPNQRPSVVVSEPKNLQDGYHVVVDQSVGVLKGVPVQWKESIQNAQYETNTALIPQNLVPKSAPVGLRF